jgi:uncharacterized glyoxalase superfamily protein PhnB
MAALGLGHIYLETHNWGKAVAFWQALGFTLELDTDHGSGMLVASNGTRLFLAEQSPEDPLAEAIYLDVADATAVPADGFEVVRPFTATHWGTQVMTIRDPDGRAIRLEAPAAG